MYVQLADALYRLPNGFALTQSCVELELLKKIFSPYEALITNQLGFKREPYDMIAKKVSSPPERVKSILMKMVQRGLVWFKLQNPYKKMLPW